MSSVNDQNDAADLAADADDLRRAVHDLRNCVHAIGIGLALLAKSREDAEKFNLFLQKVTHEQQSAVRALDKLSK